MINNFIICYVLFVIFSCSVGVSRVCVHGCVCM